MYQPGRALDSVFCERLWRGVKYENINLQGIRILLGEDL